MNNDPHMSGSTAARKRVLVLDDESAIQRLLKVVLESEGYDVVTTDDGRIALEMIRQQPIDLIIQDLRMPKMDGLQFLRNLKEQSPELPSIVLTAYGTLETAVEAMRLGAYTHINKPFDTDEIRQTVSRALERIELRKKNPRSLVPFLDIIGSNAQMSGVASLIEMAAPTDSTILITGESGTGKELVARSIHYNSLRADQAFIPVNCGAFTETLLESELFGHVRGAFTNAINNHEGVFERADRGTLFLDEVGEMSLTTQVKLLRVLETRTFKPVGGSKDMKVDVRFITATNKILSNMVADGQFREDLYYRLNVIPIQLPPLRDRKDDIPLLAGHFLAITAKKANKAIKAIDDAAIEKLLSHQWPGNVRELQNTIERAVALARGDRLTPAEITITGGIQQTGSHRSTPSSNTGGYSNPQHRHQQPQHPSQPVMQESFARSYNASLAAGRDPNAPPQGYDPYNAPPAPMQRSSGAYVPLPQSGAYPSLPQSGAYAPLPQSGAYAPLPPTYQPPQHYSQSPPGYSPPGAQQGHAPQHPQHADPNAYNQGYAPIATPISVSATHTHVTLPPEGMDLEKYLLEQERSLIVQALERSNWNLTEAAKILAMTFRSIRYRVAKLAIERPGKGIDFTES